MRASHDQRLRNPKDLVHRVRRERLRLGHPKTPFLPAPTRTLQPIPGSAPTPEVSQFHSRAPFVAAFFSCAPGQSRPDEHRALGASLKRPTEGRTLTCLRFLRPVAIGGVVADEHLARFRCPVIPVKVFVVPPCPGCRSQPLYVSLSPPPRLAGFEPLLDPADHRRCRGVVAIHCGCPFDVVTALGGSPSPGPRRSRAGKISVLAADVDFVTTLPPTATATAASWRCDRTAAPRPAPPAAPLRR